MGVRCVFWTLSCLLSICEACCVSSHVFDLRCFFCCAHYKRRNRLGASICNEFYMFHIRDKRVPTNWGFYWLTESIRCQRIWIIRYWLESGGTITMAFYCLKRGFFWVNNWIVSGFKSMGSSESFLIQSFISISEMTLEYFLLDRGRNKYRIRKHSIDEVNLTEDSQIFWLIRFRLLCMHVHGLHP